MEKRRLMKRSDDNQGIVTRCVCPYCDEELLVTALPYCRRCTVSLYYCVTCKVAVPREAEICPNCGGRLL